jgi:sporulation protein YlmC with PRC-barrel domain
MLRRISKLSGYAIEATDGHIGTVSDVLFDDATWKTRWLVVDTGHWLTGRKVLIHLSAIGAVDDERQSVSVKLTKARIKDSPDIQHDQPVSRQMEAGLYGYYGWDPYWGGSFYGTGAIAAPFSTRPYFGGFGMGERAEIRTDHDDQDPHLRSVAEVDGYHVHASDGDIGHLEDLLVDESGWGIRYLIIDTRNWWAGPHVLVSPFAVREINWADRQMRLDITREKIEASPPWESPHDQLTQIYADKLHGYYGWPGYGM